MSLNRNGTTKKLRYLGRTQRITMVSPYFRGCNKLHIALLKVANLRILWLFGLLSHSYCLFYAILTFTQINSPVNLTLSWYPNYVVPNCIIFHHLPSSTRICSWIYDCTPHWQATLTVMGSNAIRFNAHGLIQWSEARPHAGMNTNFQSTNIC